MKNYIIILFVLLQTISKAQTSEMLDTTWYLHNLQIDGMDYIPPINSDVTSIIIAFSNDGMETGICVGANAVITVFTTEVFIIQDVFLVLIECDNQESEDFESLYFGDFYQIDMSNKEFDYEIVDGTDSPRTLIITNENGDKAFYGNTILSADSFEIANVSLYPNPVNNNIKIQTDAIIAEVEVYSITGQLVRKASNTSIVEMDSLIAGVYFVKITTADGLITTRKIIKE